MASATATVATGADDAAIGTKLWANTGNITVDDATRSTAAILNSQITHYLKGTALGFAVPAGATIDGIVVEVEKSQSTAQNTLDNAVKIVKADGTVGTTNKADAIVWSTTDAIATYGSSSDLWGETWTPADVNDADFGAVIAATNSTATSVNARVDFIRITVHYTPAAGVAGTRTLVGVGT